MALVMGATNPTNDAVNEIYAFPTSYAQQRLWFLQHFEPESTAYNVPAAFRLTGTINITALKNSFSEIVRRHETLRTTFSLRDGEPKQIIASTAPVAITVIDLRPLRQSDREGEIPRLIAEEMKPRFDLEKGPLFQVSLILINDNEAVLIINMHHIISDGWSIPILFREIAVCYEAFSTNVAPVLPELPIQYADYAIWQRGWLQGHILEEQVSYWQKQLDGIPAVLNLPTDRPRPAVQSFRGNRLAIELSKQLGEELKALARKQGATLYMTLLAAFQTLLYRYTGQEEIVVGSPIAGRNRLEIEGLIGFFVNTLVLRATFAGNPTFTELLARVRETALGAYAHQDLPFEKLVEELRPDRDLSRSPLFQAMFVFQNTSVKKLNLKDLDVSPVKIAGETAKFDLTLSMQEQPEGLTGSLQYNTDLFDPSTIERMSGHFQTLLKGIVTNPDRPIAELPLLTQGERRQLLVDWNDIARDYPKDKCIHEVFEEQVERNPDAVALVFGNERVTYRDLDTGANQLAHCLRKQGVGPDDLVGLCMERSVEMVIGLLSILKAGGAYVPLDPSYPNERLRLMIDDAGTGIILTDLVSLKSLPPTSARVICVDRDWEEIAQEPQASPCSQSTADNLAYVIYTSGSTGKPKGVEVRHRGVLRLLFGVDYVQLDGTQTFLHLAPISFDAATFEVWGALLHGGKCVLFPGKVPSANELGEILKEHRVNTLWLTAALFNTVINEDPQALSEVKQLLIGGEALSVPHVSKGLAKLPNTEIINGYGPTESTTFTCCYKIPRQLDDNLSSIPIGRPIANTEIYILDAHLNPVPIGIAGELHIGGDGLARGYLNRPELTGEKFIKHPFSDDPQARLYKTGDRVRYLPDGNVEFLGRIDNQVKVRGHRIELAEIESVLNQHPKVREAAVIVREDNPGDKQLGAYVVAHEGASVVHRELRSDLREKLPDYMVPSAFVFLRALPLTANGKLDRKALPAPAHQASGEKFRNPRNPTEIALADIWSEVLKVSQVGLDDNFFDLGGHSLLAAQLMARIQNELGAELPLRVLFESPTVAQLAPKIHSKKQESIFHQREQGNYTHLFKLQAGDKTKPIFCFPFRGGLDGEFFNFTRVARHFDSQYSFYGVLARGLDGISEPRYSVQEMVADYIKEIRSVQPHGPYIFVGECQGGFVAYEAARQMVADGGEMGLLVLLDTHATLPARGFWRRRALPLKYRLGKSPAWKYFKSRYVHHIQAIRQQSARAALVYSVAKLTRVVSTVPFLIGLEQSENPGRAASDQDRLKVKLESMRQTFNLAIRRYELQPYAGRVSLLLNEQSYAANRMHDWIDYLASGLKVYRLPGGHDVCVPQNIPTVANILKECLAGVDTKV